MPDDGMQELDALIDATTVTVWVMPHDDPDVRWVVNTRSEMVENFDDLLDDMVGGAVSVDLPSGDDISYDPSRVLKTMDPVLYEQEFGRYCMGWTELQMPLDIFLAADDLIQRVWVTNQDVLNRLGGE